MGRAELSILLVLDSQDTIAEIEEAFALRSPASTLNAVHNLARARTFLAQNTPNIALVAYQLSDGQGAELADDRDLSFPVILLIEDGPLANAEQEVPKGFFDYLLSTKATLACLTDLLPLLRQSWQQQKRLDQAERLAKLGFWDWDELTNQLSYCSPGYARLHEMTQTEAMAKLGTAEQDLRSFHQDDLARYLEAEAAADALEEGVNIEYRMTTASGRIRHVHEVCEVVVDDSGRFISSSGVLQDITDRKLAQQDLAEALANADRAARLVKLGTYEWDETQDRMVACSEEFARMHELSVDETLAMFTGSGATNRLIHPDDYDDHLALGIEAFANGEGYTAEYRLRLRSGRICHIREVCEVELDNEGKVIRALGSLQNISEQVELEERLRQSQKLEAVGQLAGGIAHDFNNLLTVINGYSDIGLSRLQPDHPVHHGLSEIKKAGERAASLTHQLLAFSRKQILQPRIIDIGEIVDALEGMIQRLIGEHIELDVLCDSDLFKVKADPGQIEQVVMNLLVNARDALQQGGRIKLSVENVVLDHQAVVGLGEIPVGDYVMISVFDNGVGMAEEMLSHIFEPFYTTKGADAGTGLGLSTVFGIVKQSGGGIEVESEPGMGSTFRIYLPKIRTSEPVDKTYDSANTPDVGHETIMLVEDEDSVRELLTITLEGFGYEILAANNGAEALLSAERFDGTIDLMITDVVMPKMSGPELAEQFALIRPDMSVLYISGYNEEFANNQSLKDLNRQYLQKPFGPKAVARKIRTILDKPVSTSNLN